MIGSHRKTQVFDIAGDATTAVTEGHLRCHDFHASISSLLGLGFSCCNHCCQTSLVNKPNSSSLLDGWWCWTRNFPSPSCYHNEESFNHSRAIYLTGLQSTFRHEILQSHGPLCSLGSIMESPGQLHVRCTACLSPSHFVYGVERFTKKEEKSQKGLLFWGY